MKKIAIQGITGSFHDIAAHEYFPDDDVQPVCCDTFEEVFDAMKADESTLGLVAIENTIAGSLLHNYELLRESGMTIIGEHKLHIEHSLVCLPDDDPADLVEVNSHPVALAQCRGYLKRHPKLKIVEADDTAGAAAYIAENKMHGHAAICHRDAAKLFGLKVIDTSIQDNRHNFTRFLLCADPWQAARHRPTSECNKSSLVFSLPHAEGSLSAVLSIFSFYRINLTKIQSLPIIGREWQYMFYVDIVFPDYTRYRQSLEAVRPLTKELKILGEYAAK